MDIYSQLLESEKDEIVNALSQMNVLTVDEVATFDKFVRWVERWHKTANEIRVGYRLEEFSFHNDMDLRPLLFEQLMGLVTDITASKIQAVIHEADEIYFESTVPLKKPESDWWHYNFYPERWWRKPKILIGDLQKYYENRGIR